MGDALACRYTLGASSTVTDVKKGEENSYEPQAQPRAPLAPFGHVCAGTGRLRGRMARYEFELEAKSDGGSHAKLLCS